MAGQALLSEYVALRYTEARPARVDDEEPDWESAFLSLAPGQVRALSSMEEEVTLQEFVCGDDGGAAAEASSEPKKAEGGGAAGKKGKKGGKGGGGKGECDARRPLTGHSRWRAG